jgi:hypothetical protein
VIDLVSELKRERKILMAIKDINKVNQYVKVNFKQASLLLSLNKKKEIP